MTSAEPLGLDFARQGLPIVLLSLRCQKEVWGFETTSGVLVALCVVVFAFLGSIPYPTRSRVEALLREPIAATNAPVVGRTLRVRRNPAQTNTAFAVDYGAAGYPPSEASSAGGTMRGVRALPSPPQLRPGVRFVPDSDSGAESTRKSAKWPKSGVFSGDKEVDPNF